LRLTWGPPKRPSQLLTEVRESIGTQVHPDTSNCHTHKRVFQNEQPDWMSEYALRTRL
jgi:hypothetical protein